MPGAIEKFAAICIVLTPALVFLAYVWSRTSRTITQHQVMVGVSAGVGSLFIALVLGIPGRVIAVGQEPLVAAMLMALPGSGINEELAKALVCAHLIFRQREFQEPGQALMLCMLIGCGFALFENVGYLSDSKRAIELAYLRALTATMMHLCLAVLMGVGAIHTLRTGRFMPFVAMVSIQMILHAAYNFPLMYLGALTKSGQSFSPNFLVANGLVLVTCVLCALVALNRSGLQAHVSRVDDDKTTAVQLGGLILVFFGLATAAAFQLLAPEAGLLQKAPLQFYLAFCAPPCLLGMEMLRHAYKTRAPRRPDLLSCRVSPPQGVVKSRSFGRRLFPID